MDRPRFFTVTPLSGCLAAMGAPLAATMHLLSKTVADSTTDEAACRRYGTCGACVALPLRWAVIAALRARTALASCCWRAWLAQLHCERSIRRRMGYRRGPLSRLDLLSACLSSRLRVRTPCGCRRPCRRHPPPLPAEPGCRSASLSCRLGLFIRGHLKSLSSPHLRAREFTAGTFSSAPVFATLQLAVDSRTFMKCS